MLAIAGASLDMDANDHSLLAITQVASALGPGAVLTVRNADVLSPIERACISSASRQIGSIRFSGSPDRPHG